MNAVIAFAHQFLNQYCVVSGTWKSKELATVISLEQLLEHLPHTTHKDDVSANFASERGFCCNHSITRYGRNKGTTPPNIASSSALAQSKTANGNI